MEENTNINLAPPTPPADEPPAQPTLSVTFTPEQMEEANKIAEARADRATSSALKDFFQKQGMSEDEAKKALEIYKTQKASEKSPQELASEAQRLADKTLDLANERLIAAEIKELGGYNSKLLSKLIDVSAIKVDVDGTVSGLKEAAEACAKEYPEVLAQKNDPYRPQIPPTSSGNTFEERLANARKNGNNAEAVAVILEAAQSGVFLM